ncbi:hypothetical protein HHI_14547 [Hyphomonas hirschiana VP5]|uniref:Uncharacterized protein n=1 Tax=Hyphomonas hirschiana VP5 TaxID=1280951 RepID=A0A059FFT4_9PROT|nr:MULTISPECIES: hypothetical protein [Hyphomonas]KCZ89378.1 hypothetical protein HHI_14547 [Hyphomonas hirschiana VP5]
MGRKSGVLEFRRPKQRYVPVKRRASKFRPKGLSSRAYGPHSVGPMLRMWMLVTVCVPALAWAVFSNPF